MGEVVPQPVVIALINPSSSGSGRLPHQLRLERTEQVPRLGRLQSGAVAATLTQDGEEGYDGEWVSIPKQVSDCPLDKTKVAKDIHNADSMIVLSHLKGHELSGFGGSIKNVAMGCVTKESKAAQHQVNRVEIDWAKCTGCGKCVEDCPFRALSLSQEKVLRDDEKCMSCNDCFYLCPEGVFYLVP